MINESKVELLNKLQWRYATKAMDPALPVAQDKIDRIIEAARLAPTSSGLQPYEILVVKNPALRAQIQEVAWNQTQVTEASHLLVFAAWDDYTPERINHMFDLTNEVRGFRNEGWEAYRQQLLSTYPGRGEQVRLRPGRRRWHPEAARAPPAQRGDAAAGLPQGRAGLAGQPAEGAPSARAVRNRAELSEVN